MSSVSWKGLGHALEAVSTPTGLPSHFRSRLHVTWWWTLISFMKIKILNHKASHSLVNPFPQPPTCLFFTEKENMRPGKGRHS